MLYDPKWEQKTKADPHSLDNLITWLERQPADTTFDHLDIHGCLLARYFSDHYGCPVLVGGIAYGREFQNEDIPLPKTFADVAFGTAPYTYAAALERARAVARS